MNAVDILTKLGERPLKEYTWGDLLASHINATLGDVTVTVRTTGTEARRILDEVPPDKQLHLYKMTFPPMTEEEVKEGNVAEPLPESSPAEDNTPPESTRPQRTYLTVIGVSTAFILIAVMVISVGVTMVTTGEYPNLKIFEAFMKSIMDMLAFVVS